MLWPAWLGASRASRRQRSAWLVLAVAAVVLTMLSSVPGVAASLGDRLYEFRDCLDFCKAENCNPDNLTPIPFYRRLLLWDCPSECDQTCQHIVTASRLATGQSPVQFHGKWPFHRLLGIQEPASVAFSLGNLWAHVAGLRRLRAAIPASYPLRPYYIGFGLVGGASWVFSTLFHTRDFVLTERLDYFAAGASVLYGFFYTPVRVFRMDRWGRVGSASGESGAGGGGQSVIPVWAGLCALLYAAHVCYLTLVRWDYGYNMAANVILGTLQNSLWSWFSWKEWHRTGYTWTVWPGFAVAWVMLAMSLELFDFAPLGGVLDAHSLWHLGTIGPTIIWYNFLIKDAHDDLSGKPRFKD